MNALKCNFFVLGISHNVVGAEDLGECGMTKETCSNLEEEIIASGLATEALVLSTCNRIEIYLANSEEINPKDLLEKNLQNSKWKTPAFLKSHYTKCGIDAIAHVFEVASGLNSQMTGETEILGQVKETYARASEQKHCEHILNAVFQKTLQCAKWIRTNTQIGRGKISIGSVSSELAARIFDPLQEAKILLLGSGEAGRLVADALFVRGANNIIVASRTRQNANALANAIGCKSAELSDALADLSLFDIVICASFSEEPLVRAKAVEQALEKRCQPMFFIDLGIPQNVETAAADIDDAYVYNLSDLSKIANENMDARKMQIELAKKEILRRAQNLSEKIFHK